MIRFSVILLMLVTGSLFLPRDAQALGAFKLGAGFIPNGSIPGAMAAVEFGPISPFIEVFRKDDITTANLGGNLILKLPFPMVQPYAGAGGGISRISGTGIPSETHGMLNVMAGANVNFSGMVGLFGQAKYIYTLGDGVTLTNLVRTDLVRELGFQAGLVIQLGK